MTLLAVAKNAAEKAGAIVLRHFETRVAREVKEDKSFVTVADKEAEATIIAEIKKHFPDHGMWGEESGEEKSTSPYQWIIDPIDGTSNFVNGIPIFGISIAALKDGVPIVGVIYQPVGNALYTAEKGKGTTWRGKRVYVSDGDTEHAMISFGNGRNDQERRRLNRLFVESERFVKSRRHLGSCVLEQAFVARGSTEGIICFGLNKWDYAAGTLLVQEAGGTITDFDGKPWQFGAGNHFVASNGVVHKTLLQLVKRAGE